MEANKETTIYLDKLNDGQTELTYRFARRIKNIDDDTLSKIKKLLEGNEWLIILWNLEAWKI